MIQHEIFDTPPPPPFDQDPAIPNHKLHAIGPIDLTTILTHPPVHHSPTPII